MWIDSDVCYQALSARDARFDGRFFVGITSTGIYCRPICRARLSKRENCRFFPSAPAAEAQGFRPCLRCRPELAPGHASMDAASRLAHAAANLIENAALAETNLDQLAARLGISDRHLRRVFVAEFGVSPIAYAQTQRLLLAKRLLTDTALPISQVASAAGFTSLRRFNALFRERYRLEPRKLRKTPEAVAQNELTFDLAYRPPYAWESQLAFLRSRCIQGVESATAKCYRRTVAITREGTSHHGWLAVEHRAVRHTLRVTLSSSLAGVVPQVLGRVKHLFDLSCHPDQISNHLGDLAGEARGVSGLRVPGLRVPGAFDGFEAAVRAVLGQQITVAAANKLAGRVAQQWGEPFTTPFPNLTHLFPTAGRITTTDGNEWATLGVFRSRQNAILALARACDCGELSLSPNTDVEQTLDMLQSLPGIGEWTAQYIAMRALAWPDAFPHTDYGIKKAMGETSPRRVLQRAEPWRPWRAYAVMHLWHSLSLKEPSP